MSNQGPYKLFLHSTKTSRGVGIIIKKGIFDSIEPFYRCPQENGIILKCKLNELDIYLICLYLSDNPQTISNIEGKLPKNAIILLGGDLNTVIDPNPDLANNIDLLNRAQYPNPRVNLSLTQFMKKFNLFDFFRCANGSKNEYSFENRNGGSRLDHLLGSKCFVNRLHLVTYTKTNLRYDHAGIFCTFKKTGPSKTTPSIIRDFHNNITFLRIIKSSHITASIQQAGINVEDDENFLNFFKINSEIINLEKYLLLNNDAWIKYMLDDNYTKFNAYYALSMDKLSEILPLDINHGEILANFCMLTTNECLAISGQIRKSKNDKRNFLVNKIKEHSNDPAMRKKYQHDLLNFDLSKSHQKNYIGIATDEYEECDNLSRISSALSNPNKIKLDVLGDSDTRGATIFDHFSNFFTDNSSGQNPSIDNFLHDIDPTKLHKITNEDNQSLLAPVTHFELRKLAENLKNNKSVSLDKISNEMIKIMIKETPEPFLHHFNECITQGKNFNPFFRTSYIKLIPKKSGHNSMSGWRPIMIASAVFKLFSKLLYFRLDKIVDNLLLPPQKGFRKSRSINDVTNNLRAKLDNIVHSNKKSLLLNLDFRSAFDSINFSYIANALTFFGFNLDFVNIIENYFKGGRATVNLENGNFSPFFDIEQGVGQGLSLSVLIFIVCVEPLLIKLNFTDSLTELNWPDWSKTDRSECFADDMNVFINYNRDDILQLNNIITEFGSLSNLKLNPKKTSISFVNSATCPEIQRVINQVGYTTENTNVKILGHLISIDRPPTVTKEVELNWNKVIQKCNFIAHNIRQLRLPTLQLCNAIKTFIYSQLSYVAATTVCSKNTAKSIENVIKNLINGSGSTYSHKIIFGKNQGLNMPDISLFCRSQLVSNFLKARKNNEFWTKSTKLCFLDLNHELLELTPSLGITKMFVDEIKLFSDKKNAGKHLDLPIFSSLFKNLSNKNLFNGRPPRSVFPQVENIHPQWANLSLSQALQKNKHELDLIFGYELTQAAFFNFKNNLTIVSRTIGRKPPPTPFNPAGKLNSKKIRLFTTPTSNIGCPLFDYLTTKANTNIPAPDHKGLSKISRLRGIDINFKNFFFKLFYNKIKSPAQRVKYEEVNDNGKCSLCPSEPKATTFHQLFNCPENNALLTKINQYYFNNNIGFNLSNFLSNSLSTDTFLSTIANLTFTVYAKTINTSNFKAILKWPHFKTTFLITLKKIILRDNDFKTKLSKAIEIGSLSTELEIDLDRIV